MSKGNTKNKTVKEQLLFQIARALNALVTVTNKPSVTINPIVYSYSGTFVNFGASGGAADALGGDTVNWGTELTTASDHLGNLAIMDNCKVSKISVKWSSDVQLSSIIGSSTVTFRFFKCIDINANLLDSNNWILINELNTSWTSGSGAYPGFIEHKVNDDVFYSSGELLAFNASSSSGFSNTGEDVEVGLTLETVSPII